MSQKSQTLLPIAGVPYRFNYTQARRHEILFKSESGTFTAFTDSPWIREALVASLGLKKEVNLEYTEYDKEMWITRVSYQFEGMVKAEKKTIRVQAYEPGNVSLYISGDGPYYFTHMNTLSTAMLGFALDKDLDAFDTRGTVIVRTGFIFE